MFTHFNSHRGGGWNDTSLSWQNGDGDIDIVLPYSRAKISLSPYNYNVTTTQRVKYSEYTTNVFQSDDSIIATLNAIATKRYITRCSVQINVHASIAQPRGSYTEEKTIRYKWQEVSPISQNITSQCGSVNIVGKTSSVDRYADEKEYGLPTMKYITDAKVTSYIRVNSWNGEEYELKYVSGSLLYEGDLYFSISSSDCSLVVNSIVVFATINVQGKIKEISTGI